MKSKKTRFQHSGIWLFRQALKTAIALLVGGLLAGIIYQYQWYVPPDFQASKFLAGRQAFFHGSYAGAFYAHIIGGPAAMLLAIFLNWSGRRKFWLKLHRRLGKLLFFLVVIVLAPSGLVMATKAHTGFYAGVGFALLSVMTAAAAVLSVRHVRRGNLVQHQLWGSRLLIMLMSPLVLRLTSALAAVLDFESRVAYQFSAWGRWLLPLVGFELWQRYQSQITTATDPVQAKPDQIENCFRGPTNDCITNTQAKCIYSFAITCRDWNHRNPSRNASPCEQLGSRSCQTHAMHE